MTQKELEYKITLKTKENGSFEFSMNNDDKEINTLDLLGLAFGCLHITAQLFNKMAEEGVAEEIQFPVYYSTEILKETMLEVHRYLDSKGDCSCSCETEYYTDPFLRFDYAMPKGIRN